jgi:GNAT superfamily N-acetyltransferase
MRLSTAESAAPPAIPARPAWSDEAPVRHVAFGLAQSVPAIDQALRLVHDQYVARGYMTAHPSGRRLSPHYALSTTRVFVATVGPQVVGTVTLIEDSPLGLPMDEIYEGDLDQFRAQRCRLAEASALAVHPRYRGIGLPLLLPLMRVLVMYAADLAALDILCIAVNPRHVEFYRRLTFDVFGELRTYARVNGAPAIALCLHLDRVREIEAAVRTSKRQRDDLAGVFFTGGASLRAAERLRSQMPAASAASASFVGRHATSATVVNGVG